MAYPTVDKPYGLQPVNLIGGQVFAGSTRSCTQSNMATPPTCFYGDFRIVLNRGFVNSCLQYLLAQLRSHQLQTSWYFLRLHLHQPTD
jgi:hypothetical protein